jgi:hypothetical protein
MAQSTPPEGTPPKHSAPSANQKPKVNWLYGAYVPKDAPLYPLNGRERTRLYVAQTFTTSGIYVKTIFLSLGAQASNSPSEWGDGISGFGRRLASQHGQSIIQNSLSAAGNAALKYEPRYDRCRCEGGWPRVRHAIVRNFVTYNQTERELRPQFALYGAALGGGMIASTWRPDDRSAWSEGFHGALTQAWVGVLSNVIGEFAPEIGRLFKRKKKDTDDATPAPRPHEPATAAPGR